jgi:hypothetical protein
MRLSEVFASSRTRPWRQGEALAISHPQDYPVILKQQGTSSAYLLARLKAKAEESDPGRFPARRSTR